ncbi:MAG TPA: hypothetical protein VJL58_06870 [Pyrinomonadaceae bacterium]|nr:hypothetical protein [Pyrinomonadaceae bacterium]
MYGLLALVSLVLTVVCFSLYFGFFGNQEANTLYLILAIVFLIAMVGLGGVSLSGRVNKKEDIHITE